MLRYHGPLVAYLGRYGDSSDDVEDLLQETLVRLWRGLETYRHQGRFRAWLFTIAHNVGTTHVNQTRRTEPLRQEAIPAASERRDASLAMRELRRLIVRVVRNLPSEQRDVFLLRQDGGLSYREIAQLQEVSVSTALSRMHYAIRKLRRELDAYR